MTTDNWQDLADAIVIQAAEDYRWALLAVRRFRTGKKRVEALQMIPSCESFFRGHWAQFLAPGIDFEVLMDRIKREVAREC